MRYVFFLVFAALVVGCAPGVAVKRWDSSARSGMVIAGLCGVCAEPLEGQVSAARAKMAEKCGSSSANVLREGTESGAQQVYYESQGSYAKDEGGYKTSAGTRQSRYYYWEFACGY